MGNNVSGPQSETAEIGKKTDEAEEERASHSEGAAVIEKTATVQSSSPFPTYTFYPPLSGRRKPCLTAIIQLRDGSFLTGTIEEGDCSSYMKSFGYTKIFKRMTSYSDRRLDCRHQRRHCYDIISHLVEIDEETYANCTYVDIEIGDLSNLARIKRVKRAHEGSKITALIHIKDQNLLASGAKDGTIKLWRLPTMELERVWQAHLKSIVSLHLVDGGFLLSDSENDQVKLWDIKDIHNESTQQSTADGIDAGQYIQCVRTLNHISGNVIVFRDGLIVSLSLPMNGGTVGKEGEAESKNAEVKLWDVFEGRCFKSLDADKCKILVRYDDEMFVGVSNCKIVGWSKQGEFVFTLELGGIRITKHVFRLQNEDALAMVNVNGCQMTLVVCPIRFFFYSAFLSFCFDGLSLLSSSGIRRVTLVNLCCDVIGNTSRLALKY